MLLLTREWITIQERLPLTDHGNRIWRAIDDCIRVAPLDREVSVPIKSAADVRIVHDVIFDLEHTLFERSHRPPHQIMEVLDRVRQEIGSRRSTHVRDETSQGERERIIA